MPKQRNTPFQVRALTLFPEMFPGPLGYSLSGKAMRNKIWSLDVMDIRGFCQDKYKSVDDTPFGGGPGMVMRPDIIDAALRQAKQDFDAPLIYLTPRGQPLTQPLVHQLSEGNGIILLCGRYEGLDERVLEEHRPLEISLGDFVLSGGEPAAIALLDAIIRLLPGVMGDEQGLEEESFEQGLLEYPHYTRPAIWQGRQVPEVLISGHHEKVRAWRRHMAEEITRERRPDLWNAYQKQSNKILESGKDRR